jgi:hypothetical protein
MKHLFPFLLTLSLIPTFSFTPIKIQSSTDFNTQLTAIIADFKENIFDQKKCEADMTKCGDMSMSITDILNSGGLEKSEIKKLEALKKDADAVEDYISAVGDLSGGFATTEKINLANTRVNGIISSVQKGDFCTDIISVTIGDYICYLAENNSSKIISVNYKWKGPGGTKSGSGTVQVFANSVRAMYSNRNDKETKDLKFMGLVCK